ncbi:MAG: hypothetical protein OSB09_01350 [Planctomycetota bacterium]|nr:hypothetical protein [Planctomycetota bacterium]
MKPDSADTPLPLPQTSVHLLKELQEKGIQKLRVVTPSQFRENAKKAVAQALLELLGEVPLPAEQRQQIIERARQYMCPIDPVAAKDVKVAGVTETTVPLIRIPPPVVASTPPTETAEPDSSTTSDSPLGQREKALLVQLSRLIARDWRSELATVRDTQNTQVERLEMRIEELTLALQATDHAIAGTGDPEIDQLEVKSPFDYKKSELLDQLFQANVALRSISEGPQPGDSPSQPREGRSS